MYCIMYCDFKGAHYHLARGNSWKLAMFVKAAPFTAFCDSWLIGTDHDTINK